MKTLNDASPIAALAVALALSACNGPWNMEPETGNRPVKLWASALLVADRPLDTLWLERPVSLGQPRDGALAYVDAAESQVYVVGPAGDTVRFRPAPDRAAAWLPIDTSHRVQRGGRYDLVADVRWNASSKFPGGTEWRRETLRATTTVPRVFSFDPEFRVPVEAQHKSLSVGLPDAVIRRARAESAYRDALYDSLAALPGAGAFTAKVDRAAFAAYLEGKAPLVPARGGDTLHYIHDGREAVDYTGRAQQRYALPWIFPTRNDGDDFGGIILSHHFDSTASRILDPITASILDVFGQDLDSAEYFQAGAVRPVIIGGSYFAGLQGYPDSLRLANMLLGYTGRTVLYGYSVDPVYWEYYRYMWQSGSAQGAGLGGGNSRAQNVLPFTNVENGDGYFCGAVADSVAFHVQAAKDTLDNAALRAAWLADKAKQAGGR